MEDDAYDLDPLYVARTRPPMIGGVTDVYAYLWLVLEVTVFVGVGGGQGMAYAAAIAPACYLFGYLMCLKDPRIFELWRVRLQFFARAARRNDYWGGASIDPF